MELDADYAQLNPDVRPGEYVMVAVGDSGSGMAPEVVARAFEPFFTTKEVGKGTGLGLSMVYGFAKQSGGQLGITSELGSGTIVSLYLPRVHEQTETTAAEPPASGLVHSGPRKTVLLVEDDSSIRKMSAGARCERRNTPDSVRWLTFCRVGSGFALMDSSKSSSHAVAQPCNLTPSLAHD